MERLNDESSGSDERNRELWSGNSTMKAYLITILIKHLYSIPYPEDRGPDWHWHEPRHQVYNFNGSRISYSVNVIVGETGQ